MIKLPKIPQKQVKNLKNSEEHDVLHMKPLENIGFSASEEHEERFQPCENENIIENNKVKNIQEKHHKGLFNNIYTNNKDIISLPHPHGGGRKQAPSLSNTNVHTDHKHFPAINMPQNVPNVPQMVKSPIKSNTYHGEHRGTACSPCSPLGNSDVPHVPHVKKKTNKSTLYGSEHVCTCSPVETCSLHRLNEYGYRIANKNEEPDYITSFPDIDVIDYTIKW